MISVDKISNKLRKVVLLKDIDIYEAYACAQEKSKAEFIGEEAAQNLHTKILHLKSTFKSLPYPFDANDILKGEREAPNVLLNILKVLYTCT